MKTATSAWNGISVSDIVEVALLQSYNTRLVVLSTIVLGVASGLIGSFLLLRKRSLIGDALSHACLPGIVLAFMIMVALGGSGKSLPGLFLGAAVSGLAGVGVVLLIRNTSRIKDDTAMGLVLSVFFGGGVALLGLAQAMPQAGAAGLESFIYGRTASMILHDFIWIVSVAGVTLLAGFLLYKEMVLLCFDEGFAASQGWPVKRLDAVMLGLVAAITVVGLQAVGLILMIAFLITPAAAARFWTEDARRMTLLAGALGGLSGWLGASISALAPRLPAGAIIVLVAAGVFVFSMLFGTSRGIATRVRSHRKLVTRVGRQHLLRAVYELLESSSAADVENAPVPNAKIRVADLVAKRSWSRARVQRLIDRALKEDHVDFYNGERLRLSESGFGEAARITRNHRLWEMYLIAHADIAPQHVDRDADMVEHVLGPELIAELEREIIKRGRASIIPASPHVIVPVRGAA
ncbi:MAG TPA: iron chelate uptake ABC transporter family permease subunit [Kiritimatiellia bacterium]|nr:iron chelate uptake ABC transporter family permease subunit [Kiritimatiellia bacterium]HMO99852.1 iron chelate uptake ABC transporter family permease subunit [Kiritimatiellia bacterium]HMP96364.1 iron chelate uptake ABC transporter family permease subunit [Kiritimatiellia bacterium]